MAKIVNRTVIDGGREYRVAFHGSRPLIVALKPIWTGKERPLNLDGRRAIDLIAKARAEGPL